MNRTASRLGCVGVVSRSVGEGLHNCLEDLLVLGAEQASMA